MTVWHEGRLQVPGERAARRRVAPLVTHRFKLERIEEAYGLIARRRDDVIKVAISP
jgi:threonine dehydrogenase-like Zn-dependent dehydrogenase